MRKIFALHCIITLTGVVPQSIFAAPLPFPDMEYSWFRYREAVSSLKDRNIIRGYHDGTFKPQQTVNRAEFLKMLFAGEHAPIAVTRPCFGDVAPEEWYAPYVCAAERRGIVQGYADGTFKPAQEVNMVEAIKMSMHAYGWQANEGTGEQWYKPLTEALDAEDVFAEHSYLPAEPLRRERAADLLWRLLQFKEDRTTMRLSPGCGKAAPDSAPHSVDVSGAQRNVLLTVPADYVNHDPTPLIVAFHGRTNGNGQVQQYFGLDAAAPEAFIAYPAALSNGNGTYAWSNPGDRPESLRDLRFFDAIVEEIAYAYCIDMDQIFVVGHSLGAWFANSVACMRGDAVRASGTVGGDSVIAHCRGPAAAFLAHNPLDTLAPFSATERTRDVRVKGNACSSSSQEAEPEEFRCRAYDGCNENPVLWCPHRIDTDGWSGTYYPHNWPRETAGYILTFFRSLR